MPSPPTLDGSAGAVRSGANACTVTLTTTNANDVICVLALAEAPNGTAPSVTSVSGGGLTWAKRAQARTGTNTDLELWWAAAASSLSSVSITVTYAANFDDCSVQAFGVSGCSNLSAPWDVNSSVPATASYNAAATPSFSGISTTSAADFLIFAVGINNATNGAIPSGFTAIGNVNNAGGSWYSYLSSAYQRASAAQSSASFAWGASMSPNGSNGGLEAIFDALSASSDVMITVTGVAATGVAAAFPVFVGLTGSSVIGYAGSLAGVGQLPANFNFTHVGYTPAAPNAVNFNFGTSSLTLGITGVSATGGVGNVLDGPNDVLTGVVTTSAFGSVGYTEQLAALGNSLACGLGTLAPSVTLALSGNASTGSVGAMVSVSPLTGVASTTAINGVTPTQAVSGNTSTSGIGSIASNTALALGGLAATGAVGLLTPTQALSGVASTSALGSVGFTFGFALAGNASAGSINAVTPTQALSGLVSYTGLGNLKHKRGSPGLSPTGVVATGSAGSLTPTQAAQGIAATSATGTVVPGVTVGISGVQAAGSEGSVDFVFGFAALGNAATGGTGSVTAQAPGALTTVAVTGQVGSPVADLVLALSGNVSTGSVGAAGVTISPDFTGVVSLTGAGTMVIPPGDQAYALTGVVSGGSAVGNVTPAQPQSALSGNAFTGSVGNAPANVSIGLSGNASTGSAGSPGSATALASAGVSTRGAVGVLSPQLFTLLTGLPASMQVGSTGTGTPLTGVAVVSTPGTIVVDVTPQALSGVGAVGAIGNAGPMFNPGLPEVLVVTAATERAFATQPVQVAVRELAPQVLAVVKPTNVLIAPRPVQVPVITQEPEVDVGV